MANSQKRLKKLFHIFGHAEGVGWIDECVHAVSRAQAVKLIDMRLRERWPGTNLYLGNCEVQEVPQQTNERKEVNVQSRLL